MKMNLLVMVAVLSTHLSLDAMTGRNLEQVFVPYKVAKSDQEKNSDNNGPSGKNQVKKTKIPCNVGQCSGKVHFASENLLRSHQALNHFICPYCSDLLSFDSYAELIDQHYIEMKHERDYCKHCRNYVYVKPDKRKVLTCHENRCLKNLGRARRCSDFHIVSVEEGKTYDERLKIVACGFDRGCARKSSEVSASRHDKFARTSPQEKVVVISYPDKTSYPNQIAPGKAVVAGAYLNLVTQSCGVVSGTSGVGDDDAKFGYEFKCYVCFRKFDNQSQFQMHCCG